MNLGRGHDGQHTMNLKEVKTRLSGCFESRPWDLETNFGNAPGDTQHSEGGWLRVTKFEFGGCSSGSRVVYKVVGIKS